MSRIFDRFKQDIVGIGYIALSLFLGLALFSFNPQDPSLNSIGRGLSVTNYCGYVGSFLADALYQLFGITSWVIVLGFVRLAVAAFSGQKFGIRNIRVIWASLLMLTTSALISVYFAETKIFQGQIFLGGLVGAGASKALIAAFNPVGVQIILWSLFIILMVFFSERALKDWLWAPRQAWGFVKAQKPLEKLKVLLKSLRPKVVDKPVEKKKEAPKGFFPLMDRPEFTEESTEEIAKEEPEEEEGSGEEELLAEEPPAPKPTARRKVVLKTKVSRRVEHWELPKLSMLEDPPASRIKVDEREIRRKTETLTDKLAQFNVNGEVVGAKPGPAVTMFEFRPNANVRVSKITELADDLALALSSESLRIIAPIPGRDVVGIETSNAQRETVYLKDLLADEQFWRDDIKLPLALGKQANGDPKIVDLRKMPHLMIAGTTGSGKSVFTVSAITGLLFKHSPKTLKLILIDPKQVDLAAFDKVPHLALPIVTDTRLAVNSLKWAVREMEKRYKSMSRFGARGLEAYNETVAKLTREEIEEHEKTNQELEATPGKKMEQYYYTQLPYIVIVVEEFGDLMAVDKNNVEAAVVRLAQMARACGIHLMLAMQSPRREVVTGLIKTNIPGRISFKVNSSMDSRIILDEVGAERLLAQGDMLYKSPGGSTLVRHHGPFLKDAEITEVAQFWSAQAEPEFDQSAIKYMEATGADAGGEVGAEFGEESYDERYDEILSWASTQKAISASLIQRRFQLGYPRAARIMEVFEREGVVGPANGSKPRQVLVNNLNELGE